MKRKKRKKTSLHDRIITGVTFFSFTFLGLLATGLDYPDDRNWKICLALMIPCLIWIGLFAYANDPDRIARQEEKEEMNYAAENGSRGTTADRDQQRAV
ncbi:MULTISPECIES: hypothetical protein [unclassified Bilifractor]|uniref:hypothetical protein n=1 Tax=unclassified Bilifractor TaxID=2815795 RepID=UPI003F91B7C7